MIVEKHYFDLLKFLILFVETFDNLITKESALENIIEPLYSMEYVNDELLDQIKYHEAELTRIRKEAGLYVNIYVPQSHPIPRLRLFKVGKKLEWNEYEGNYKQTFICDSKEDITDADLRLQHLKVKLTSPNYTVLKCLFEQSNQCLRVSGFSMSRLL